MRVLIAYDGSVHAMAAIDDMSRAGLPRQTEAIVVSVAHGGWPHPKTEGKTEKPWHTAIKEAETLAEEGKSRVEALFPSWSVSCEALWGDPASILLKTIDVFKADLVVVGSHGRSLPGRLLLGSVSTELVHHAPCSVRVVRRPSNPQGGLRLLVATDGSDQAQACVDAVTRRAWPEGTTVRVLAVMQTLVPTFPAMPPAIEAETFRTELAARVIEESDDRELVKLRCTVDGAANRVKQAGLIADALVLDGDSRLEITAEAERWGADSVFVGARGLDALDRLLLGSVSSAVVHHAPCAVEIVRHR